MSPTITTTFERQWNSASRVPGKTDGFPFLRRIVVCRLWLHTRSLQNGVLQPLRRKKKTGHKVLIYARYKVHPATEKLSHKAHLSCALEVFLEAVWVLNQSCHDRNIFFYMLCLPKSLSYERFSATTGGDWGTLFSCLCVPNDVWQTKATTFNATLSVDSAALVTVFVYVHIKKGRGENTVSFFFFSETKGWKLENNCSSRPLKLSWAARGICEISALMYLIFMGEKISKFGDFRDDMSGRTERADRGVFQV